MSFLIHAYSLICKSGEGPTLNLVSAPTILERTTTKRLRVSYDSNLDTEKVPKHFGLGMMLNELGKSELLAYFFPFQRPFLFKLPPTHTCFTY